MKWRGHVEKVGRKYFIVRAKSEESEYDEYHIRIPISYVTKYDRPLLQEGCFCDVRTDKSRLVVKFLHLGNWTKKEIESANRRAKALAAKFNII